MQSRMLANASFKWYLKYLNICTESELDLEHNRNLERIANFFEAKWIP